MGKEIVAMILAGGRGTRLKELTAKVAKPAVHFGGKYRIIDFPLSNCANSGIDIVGVLTQYESVLLGTYVGAGTKWGLDGANSLAAILPARERDEVGATWYAGTADAIYQNLDFLDRYDPEYVLILSGDHIYKMDYDKMLQFHKEKNAEATIAVIEVPMEEACRFGIMNTNEDLSIYEFEEKPAKPKSNMASMGVYIFNWKLLRQALKEDEKDKESSNDFGKNIIPKMLNEGRKLVAYPFKGYWKDVGTISSLWEANMDLLKRESGLNLYEDDWKIYSVSPVRPAQYIGKDANVKNSLIVEGCTVHGTVENSVLFEGVYIGKNTVIRDSVIMTDAKIGDNVVIDKAIIGGEAKIRKDCKIGNGEKISVIASKEDVKSGTVIDAMEV